jgi:drug/metabolite transporter (DMT)-like permease
MRLSCRRGAPARASGEAAAEAPAAPQKPPSTFAIGIAWFFAHQIIGVANDVIMKLMGQNLGVSQVVFMRFLFATLSMLPVMLGSKGSFKTSRLPLHFARSVLLAGGIWLYVLGLSIAPIAVVTTLNFTIPLFTLVLATAFLKEKVELVRWVATLVGFAGVMVVLQPGGVAFNPQWLCVLVSAAMFSSLDVLNKKFVGEESFWAMIFYTAFFTACITAVPAAMSWVAPTLSQCGLLALLGGGANALLFCILKSFSYVDASALAPFRYTELLLSAGVGFLLFSEIPAASTLLGAFIIVPSTLFVVWQENRRR